MEPHAIKYLDDNDNHSQLERKRNILCGVGGKARATGGGVYNICTAAQFFLILK